MVKQPKKKAATKVSKSTVVASELPELPAPAPAPAPVAAVQAPVDAPAPDGAPAPNGAQLTIADLQSLASVIDVAVRRGAFGAGEVTEVGAIFDKLSGFLKVIAAQKEAADKAAGASVTEGKS